MDDITQPPEPTDMDASLLGGEGDEPEDEPESPKDKYEDFADYWIPICPLCANKNWSLVHLKPFRKTKLIISLRCFTCGEFIQLQPKGNMTSKTSISQTKEVASIPKDYRGYLG